MANMYLRSTDGSDASDGLSWANAKATLVGAYAGMAAGDTCWVSQAHAETQSAAMTLTSPGTAANPCKVLCVNDGAAPPTAPATGASISTTNGNLTIGPAFCTFERITFNCGSAANANNLNMNNTATQGLVFDSCAFNLVTTNSGSIMALGSTTTGAPQSIRFNNCTFSFANVAQNIANGKLRSEYYGGSIAATGSIPTEVFTSNINIGGLIDLIGVDLSTIGSGKGLVAANSGGPITVYRFMGCKLGASVSVTTGSFDGPGGIEIWLFNCDSGDVHYKLLGRMWEGSIDIETTLVMTGGSSDGATTFSTKMSPSASVSIQRPLYSQWLYGPYITSLGSAQNATVEILCDNASNLTNAEVWLELYYQGTSGTPLAIYAHDRITSHLTTPAAQDSSSVTWTTTGMAAPKKQKCVVSFTPQERGHLMGRVAVAKPSAVVYVNTEITVT